MSVFLCVCVRARARAVAFFSLWHVEGKVAAPNLA